MLNYIRTVYTHLYTSQEHIYVSWISFFFSFHASLPNLTLTILTLRTTSKFLICSLVALWNFLPFLWEFYCYLLLSLLLSFFSLFLCCHSVVQLYPTLWNPVNCSTPDFPISHHLLELAQTCVHWVGDTIQPSCPLSSLSVFPRIRVFSNESVLRIRRPKYWSFSISHSNEHSGLISFRMDWLDLLAVQGTLKSLLQHHSAKASILWCSAIFMVQLSHP